MLIPSRSLKFATDFSLCRDGFLAGDFGQVAHDGFHNLLIVSSLTAAYVDDDLLKLGICMTLW